MKLYDVPQIGGKMYLRDSTDLWGFLQNGEYEPHETELVKKIVKKDWVCLDIGANIGYYTILMAKQCHFVYAFEPEPNNYKLLSDNLTPNNFNATVLLFEAAIGANQFIEPLYLCDASHGMHRMFKSKFCDKSIPVKTTTIDTEFKETKFDFIKIDVEGTELGVLQGATKTIERDKPQMLIEFHPPTLEEAGTRPQDVYDFLVKRGYKIELVWPNESITNYEQLDKLTRNESGGQNIFCQ